MTVTITRDNGDSTFTFTVTALQAIVEDTADAAARYIYPLRWQLYTEGDDPQPILYDDLTSVQKLAVLNKELKSHLRAMARSGYVTDAGEVARETAQIEADSKFDL